VIGVMLALYHRDARGGEGQFIDVALYESVFNVMESLLPEYDAFGVVRERAGSALPGIVPTNAYRCKDGSYVLVAGNGDSIYRRLMAAIGRPDLENDPALAHNDGRAANAEKIDRAIEAWTLERTQDEILPVLDAARVPAGKIYSVADIAGDPQYLAREMIVETADRAGEALKVPASCPSSRSRLARCGIPRRISASTRTRPRRAPAGRRAANRKGNDPCHSCVSTCSKDVTPRRWPRSARPCSAPSSRR
jgi:formyl-CoA transferase